MWVVARRTKHADDEYSSVSGGDDDRAHHEATYRRLRNLYLSVYACATFGDWIQGGFLYALYAEYGYSMRQIGLIFVVGYASAATVGTYVSALGDTGGHRRNCVLYGILYAASCLLCNFKSLGPLLLGRLLGGIAYSILYTSFESWLISEADARRLPMPLLSRLFSVATFFNAGSAVVAGMAGHLAVEVIPHTSHNKFASAFDVGVIVLLISSALAAFRWAERFGGDGSSSGAAESLCASIKTIRHSRALIYLGLVNSLYEAALYVFVFLWTPALERRAALSSSGGTMGHGLVFSIFMLSKMAGSQAFHALSSRLSPSAILQLVFAGSAACLTSIVFTESYDFALLSFCGFEGLLGMYWPAIALIRCGSIDDAQRASTMAVFRVLLNVLVITLLPLAGGLPEAYALSLAVIMLLVCLACIRVVKAEEEATGGVGRRRGGSDSKLEKLDGADDEERRSGKSAASPTSPLCAAVCDDAEETRLCAGGKGAGGEGAHAGVQHAGADQADAHRSSVVRLSVSEQESDGDSADRRGRDSSPGFHAPSSAENAKGLEGIARRAWEYLGSPGTTTPRRGKYSPVTVSALTETAHTPDELSPSDESFARHASLEHERRR